MKITVFKSVTSADTKAVYVSPEHVFGLIRDGAILPQIKELRGEASKSAQARLKKKLPGITFTGEFSARGDKNLVTHSGLMSLDFDDVPNVAEKKAQISSHPFVMACFVSPRGNGLKAVVRIPPDAEKHTGRFRALNKLFPDMDPRNINLERICFLSADPEIYVNMDCEEFDGWEEDVKAVKNGWDSLPQPGLRSEKITNDYSKIDIAVKMIRTASDGEKHGVLLKASKLMGGYISAGIVEEVEAVRILEQEIASRDIDDFAGASKTISDGISYGKTQPIFEMEREYKVQATSSGIRVADDVWDKMQDTFRNGKSRGETTHFSGFDANFTWKKGEITLVIGRPNVGKSEFVQQLMLMRSVFNGWKWGVYSPEAYPEDEFFDSLIHSYIGQTPDPYYTGRQMSMTDYRRGYEFVREHFFYVYPNNPTVNEVDRNFQYLIEEKGISGTLIDPFNQLVIDYSLRDDQFLSGFLSERKRIASKYNICSLITSHPKSMLRGKDGEYPIADVYDVAGGAMWSNKADNILVVHRPFQISEPMRPEVEIHVRKIKKQKLVGIPGMCCFDYDKQTNRYYQSRFNPLEKKLNEVFERPKLFDIE